MMNPALISDIESIYLLVVPIVVVIVVIVIIIIIIVIFFVVAVAIHDGSHPAVNQVVVVGNVIVVLIIVVGIIFILVLELLPLPVGSQQFNKLSGSAAAGAGTEATALHFGWGAWHMRQGPGLLPSSFKVHLRQNEVDWAMAILTRVVLLCAP